MKRDNSGHHSPFLSSLVRVIDFSMADMYDKR